MESKFYHRNRNGSTPTLAVLYNFLLAGNQGDVTIKIHFNEMKKIFPHFFERF